MDRHGAEVVKPIGELAREHSKDFVNLPVDFTVVPGVCAVFRADSGGFGAKGVVENQLNGRDPTGPRGSP